MFYLLFFAALLILTLVYFKLATHYNIVDKPNHRSSHVNITIRGGGIIFPLALFIHFGIAGFEYPYFMLGLLIISAVSFADDIRPLSNKIRIIGHLASVSLIFFQAELFSYPLWILMLGYIIMIGTINAYNFMDGINGITGGYSLVVAVSMWFVNQSVFFIDQSWILVTLIALLVYNYFNFRRRALCFAGDVGSISMAFVVLFFMVLLLNKSGDLKYIGFLLLYGLDAISTIGFRIIRKENIFVAHRTHFYQFLANNLRWPHLRVSGLYMAVQLLLNVVIITMPMHLDGLLIFFLIVGLLFLALRLSVEGWEFLLGKVTEK